MRRFVLVLAGCYTGRTEPIANHVPAPPAPALMTVSRTHFGPLGATTPATLLPLRRAFVGFTVKPLNDTSLSYMVVQGDEEIAWVIPTAEGAILNVHAKSGKVAFEGRRWRVGGALTDANLIGHSC